MGPITTPFGPLKKSALVHPLLPKPIALSPSSSKGGCLQPRKVAFKQGTLRMALDPLQHRGVCTLDDLASFVAASSTMCLCFALYFENARAPIDLLAFRKKRNARQFRIQKRSPQEFQKANMWLYFVERLLCRLLKIR